MNKRINIISATLIAISFFVSLILPMQASAAAYNYDGVDVQVVGKVITVEDLSTDGTGQYTEYDVTVTEVYKGKLIKVGQKIKMSHDCSASPIEDSGISPPIPTKAECIKNTPKVGDEVFIFMDWGLTDDLTIGYYQPDTFEDQVIKVYGVIFFSANLLLCIAGGVLLAGIIVAVILIAKKQKSKKSKSKLNTSQ